MKSLVVKKVDSEKKVSLSEAEKTLENATEKQVVDTLNWKEFPYRPEINFRIAHTGSEILLKYYVKEKNILAQETRTNGDVYKDSTVEFFVSLDGRNYYNFEFSCIGTRHLAYGPDRNKRALISPEIVEKIEINSTLGNQPFAEKSGNFDWEMMIRIPISTFIFDDNKVFDGINATANFYKCGDETSDPHFVTWNPVGTESPDYHRPEFFGKLHFEG